MILSPGIHVYRACANAILSSDWSLVCLQSDSNYVQISYLSPIYMPFKSVFERNPVSSFPNTTYLKIWASSNGRFDWLNRFDDLTLFIKSHVESRDVPKKLTQHLYDFRFSCRFVLVHVAYLSSWKTYINH